MFTLSHYNDLIKKLLLSHQDDCFFRISKLVKSVTKDNEAACVVIWVRFRGRPTIDLRKDLMEDVPKTVNLYESRNGIKFRTDKNKKLYVYEAK